MAISSPVYGQDTLECKAKEFVWGQIKARDRGRNPLVAEWGWVPNNSVIWLWDLPPHVENKMTIKWLVQDQMEVHGDSSTYNI